MVDKYCFGFGVLFCVLNGCTNLQYIMLGLLVVIWSNMYNLLVHFCNFVQRESGEVFWSEASAKMDPMITLLQPHRAVYSVIEQW